MARPNINDLTGDHDIARIARETWLTSSSPPKVLASTIDQIWTLVDRDVASKTSATSFSLLLLEQLQALERYLWPGYTNDASNHHLFLLVLLVNLKRNERLPVWPAFASKPDEFADFFSRVIHLSVDASVPVPLRTHLVIFVDSAFQSLDHGLVRKECAPLVAINIWHNLHSAILRERHLTKGPQLQKAWRSAGKRYDSADATGQARLRFERSWLYTLLLHLLDKLYDVEGRTADEKQEHVLFCERLLELLCDLQSQLPTRRYVNTLMQDLNLLPAILLSPVYETNESLRRQYDLLAHYTYFPVDDRSGRQFTEQEFVEAHNAQVSRLQKIAQKLLPDKLKILILANFGSVATRDDIQGLVEALTDTELASLCQAVHIRTAEYPEQSLVVRDRAFFVESLAALVGRKPFYAETMRKLAVLPTEAILYEFSMLQTDKYDGTHPLSIPKLNLQYLTIGDFLWRSFTLYRYESFYAIRAFVEDTIKRLQPRRQAGATRFDGFSRMAIPINAPAVIEVSPPRVGEVAPAEVKVEVILDVSRLQPGLRREWESLKPDDTVMLAALHPIDTTVLRITNGHGETSPTEKLGLKALRCAEVISVLDENGKMLRYNPELKDQPDNFARPRQRRLLLRLDAAAYKADKSAADAGKGDIYESINLVLRRKARENNFRPVLESIKQLAVSESPVPEWLLDVFLGYGDPASASYKRLEQRLRSVDYRDTFLDWQHLIESLPGKAVEPDPALDGSFPPPYVLASLAVKPVAPPRPNKKRRRDQPEDLDPAPAMEAFKVSTYKPSNTGPYISDAPKLNAVRFTPTQIEAVTSGTQPGLTLVMGPPGTGKTDVATQIINNIYHNFPQQRTLLIAHSNQALNQLFQKIIALDIDERHLLRLGHGEEELLTEASFSKAGRVESFLERGAQYLVEVQRLADSINAPGAHGNSCETAEYFDQVYIQPRWKRFWEVCRADDLAAADLINAFPFHAFFADAPQPLFPPSAAVPNLMEIARGCERHIRRVFTELADIRPFEILRTQRDKSNYLLVKEARIIAMTSTHAAIRRHDIVQLGFHYDNVVMEEAAQTTEIENFIPLVLQAPRRDDVNGKSASSQLQRIILIGDHLQNSPVVQSEPLKSYSNLEQSLFQRLIRLGAPHIQLDAQGRSRPSLAALYKWRYPHLTNLPTTSLLPEFSSANPGFRYDYQFIEVPDFKGHGESEPSPHFLQNLGEAEYAVALYQYMRLLGYPASRISILTTYAGQRALIRDVLAHRCKNHRLFGLPAWVGTVDKYQGEQNDYIILSLVRTKSPGYLRDIRRLTVALSRARLGLYVLGRRAVFESTLELREAFDLLFAREQRLQLVTGELFADPRVPSDTRVRTVEEAHVPNTVEMHGLEHLGAYIVDMTKAKVHALRNSASQTPLLLNDSATHAERNGDDDDGRAPAALEPELEHDAEDLDEHGGVAIGALE